MSFNFIVKNENKKENKNINLEFYLKTDCGDLRLIAKNLDTGLEQSILRLSNITGYGYLTSFDKSLGLPNDNECGDFGELIIK